MSTRLPILEQLAATGTYRSRQMGLPPAETLPHVVQFELTTGCKYNACNFCGIYKKEKFSERTFPEFKDHVNDVFGSLPQTELQERNLKRIFIGAGNSLSVDTYTLNKAIQYSIFRFYAAVGSLPSRVALYGTTEDILEKGAAELSLLHCGGTCDTFCASKIYGERKGLDLLYWGPESGSTEVNEFAATGTTKRQILDAIKEINGTRVHKDDRLRTSVTIIPGLGGKRLWKAHTHDTIEALNKLKPEYVTFMGIRAPKGSGYETRMQREIAAGENRPLTPTEIALQTAEIIDGLKFETIIGCHGADIHQEEYNPTSFGSVRVRSRFTIRSLADRIRQAATANESAFSFEGDKSEDRNRREAGDAEHGLEIAEYIIVEREEGYLIIKPSEGPDLPQGLIEQMIRANKQSIKAGSQHTGISGLFRRMFGR